ncbi:MAG: arylesterase [Verrucomicrobia bacterium]|nr:arylesterase [Verrucomicrobiota bacterium]
MPPTLRGFPPRIPAAGRRQRHRCGWPDLTPLRWLAGVFIALAAGIGYAASPGDAAAADSPRTIVFFGDSLTAGYGLFDPAHDAYPAVIQRKLATAGLPWRVVNAGLSGETTSGGLRRVDWTLRQPVDIFFLALGANDGLRGINPELSRRNLESIITRVRARYPQARVVLAGMQMPPELGPDYTREFSRVYPEVAAKCDTLLMPFLLEGVGGSAELNQGDRIHPNRAGHAAIAETVWKVLRPLL